MSVARFAFGPRLKAHRERQGITLQDIAESTKIGASLLSSLERNDVSQWPKGIYRRAFLRSYARAINVPFESVWAEFVQLFPEDGTAPTVSRLTEVSELRLTLAASSQPLWPPATRNIIAAIADIATVLVVGLGLSWLTGLSAWMSLTCVSIAYATLSTALVGGSLVQWCLPTQQVRRVMASTDGALVAERQPDLNTAPMMTAEDNAEPSGRMPRQRARIFAVTSTRSTGATEARERRVADR